MPKIWRVYSGADGKSHIAEEPMALKPFKDLVPDPFVQC